MVNKVLSTRAPGPGAATAPYTEGRERIEPPNKRSAAVAGYIEEPLARLDGAAEARAGFSKTFVNDRQQRSRRERLAQAARGTEFERHAQEVRRGRVEVGKGVS